MGPRQSKEKPPPKKSSGGGKITEKDKAILQLKLQRDKLNAQQRKIENQVDECLEKAKVSMNEKKKERALYFMKRKKALEAQSNQCFAHQNNVQSLIDSIQFMQMEHEVSAALKSGGDALAKLNKLLSVEEAEAIIEDVHEQISIAKDVSNLLAESLTPEDDEEVLKEMAKLELENMQAVPSAELPTVEPKVEADKTPVANKEEEESSPIQEERQARVLA